MPRPSPQTERVVAVVDLLATYPGEDFTLAELARRLGVSKPTCYPMLATLTRAGWLLRHPTRKTYRLGPALVPAGRAAAAGAPVIDLARPRMAALAEATGLTCMGLAPSADDLVVVELVGPPALAGGAAGTGGTGGAAGTGGVGGAGGAFGLRLGDTIPPRPPFGAVLVAWHGDEAAEAWLQAGGATGERRRRYEADLAAVRRRGYAVELREPIQERIAWLADQLRNAVADRGASGATARIHDLVDQAVGDLADEHVLLTDIDPDRTYRPSSINAPVFDPEGVVALVVCLIDARSALPGREVAALGEHVRSMTTDLTRALRGRMPTPNPG
jgi:DNA-binding IclR family transcriptional regulator